MIVNAEIQRKDGSWRSVKLWVDSGNPDFMISQELARDLQLVPSDTSQSEAASFPVDPPQGVRVAEKSLKIGTIRCLVVRDPAWLFTTMHVDANLPSTILKHYQVVFDYPRMELTLADPGTMSTQGERSSAFVNDSTGIVQMQAIVDEDTLSLALDNGASFSFLSSDVVNRIEQRHEDLPALTGAVGCANMWGWWPGEQNQRVIRLPGFTWGSTKLQGIGTAGIPHIGEWYSRKTVRPVAGFLGANALREYRIEIDYVNSSVYLSRGERTTEDFDMVGLTVRLEENGDYRIVDVARKDGKPVVEGIEPGDILIRIDDLNTRNQTMGTVVDALRGKPGELRTLHLERHGNRFAVQAVVKHLL